MLNAQGDYTGARKLLEKAMSSAEKNFGPDHPTTAVRYSNLAMVLKGIGDYEPALALSEKSLTILQNRADLIIAVTHLAQNPYSGDGKIGRQPKSLHNISYATLLVFVVFCIWRLLMSNF